MVLCTCHSYCTGVIIPIYNHAQFFLQSDGRDDWLSADDHTMRLGDTALY